MALDELQRRVQIQFRRPKLLAQALTHRSYTAETEGTPSNERLEFLGDAVLGLVIAEDLYRRHDDWPEGELTKAKAAVVNERALERLGRAWRLGPHIRLSHGEQASGGRERRALLADVVEAIIGAFYLDRGLAASRELILREMAPILAEIERQEHERDYKTQLQEVLQSRFQAAPTYEVTAETGPPHERVFQVAVSFLGEVLGRGMGRSKKEAEQQAAAEALRVSPQAQA